MLPSQILYLKLLQKDIMKPIYLNTVLQRFLENNYLFYIFSLISLNAFILIFYGSIKSKDTIFDLALLLTLFLLDIDGVFYHETYDPLLYFIFFLLIKNKIYLNFTKKLTDKKFILLILFCTSFYALSILKTTLSN